MPRLYLFSLLAAAVLSNLGCGITFNLPVDQIVTGPTQTQEILIPAQDVEVVDLSLNFGAGELMIHPAQDGEFVQGTARYNVPEFEPRVEIVNQKVKLSTGDLEIRGIPNLKGKIENYWDIRIGSQQQNLEIVAGAYNADLELGGLALKSLDVTDGAANVRVQFSVPNRVEMDRLRYQTGASAVSLSGLANANFKSMIFRGGAGDYKLDFSGSLKDDASVIIETGFSQLIIVVPRGTTAKVITGGGMMNIRYQGGWEKVGRNYQLGSGGSELIINVDMGAGNLQLRTE